MGFAVTFQLGHFQERFPAAAHASIGRRQRLISDSGQREHLAVAKICIVRNSDDLTTGAFLVARQELPEIFRVPAIVGAEWNDLSRLVCIVSKDHDSVQVSEHALDGANGGPFVPGERGTRPNGPTFTST